MMTSRKFLALILVCLIFVWLPVSVTASEMTDACASRMVQLYLQDQQQAKAKIENQMAYLTMSDPQKADMWKKIMKSWDYHNSDMSLYASILPDGLPQDDSLCIVILGYGLNKDGSMRQELVERLKVGLASAEKYPNAYVAVTGGATSEEEGVTEAGQMAAWLKQNGLSIDRLIVERKSLSTIQNAQNICRILSSDYPDVDSVALITSDYHIRRACTYFSTVSHVNAYNGKQEITVVGNAVNYTGKKVNDLKSQAQGICAITGIPFEG